LGIVASSSEGQLISGGGFDVKIQIYNIHGLQRACQREIFREKPTSAAAYLTRIRRLTSIRLSLKSGRIELNDASDWSGRI
jgi:hypothetical protein